MAEEEENMSRPLGGGSSFEVEAKRPPPATWSDLERDLETQESADLNLAQKLKQAQEAYSLAQTKDKKQRVADAGLMALVGAGGPPVGSWPDPADEWSAAIGLEAADKAPGIAMPGRQIVDEDKLPQVDDPDLVGHQKRMSALSKQYELLQKQAVNAQKMAEGRGQYGHPDGKEETRSEAVARLRKGKDERDKVAMDRMEGYLIDAKLSARYPGLDLDEAKRLQGVMGRELNNEDYSTPQEFIRAKQRHISDQASAKSKLRKATQIQTDRAFGNIAAKVVAALSIGAGAHAAVIGGGRNVAFDLYNNAIARDIAAQKEAFAHKRGAPGRAQKEYSFLMKKLGDEDAAIAGTLAIKYDLAVDDLRATAAKFPALMESEKYKEAMGKLEQGAADAKRASQMASRKAIMSQDSGAEGIKWIGGTKLGLDEQVKTDREAMVEVRRKANVVQGSLNRFKDALISASFLEKPWSEKHAQVKALREGLISELGVIWGKGVLQQFEREQIEAILPGEYPRFEMGISSFTDRINAGLNALTDAAEDKVRDTVQAYSHYEYVVPKRKRAWIRTTGERGKR